MDCNSSKPGSPQYIDKRPKSNVSKTSLLTFTSPLTSANRIPFTPKGLLAEWEATSIAGNDLLSSILYTIGITGAIAGRWTPLCLLIVSVMILFPFKRMYKEIGAAMPQNGGTFNLVLQLFEPYLPLSSTSSPLGNQSPLSFLEPSPSPLTQEQTSLLKIRAQRFSTARVLAAVAGVLSLLSYVTTAVVSAATAIAYGAGEFKVLREHEYVLTLCILGLFALVTFMGIKESSKVAYVIFTIHLSVFSILFIGAFIHALFIQGGRVWASNLGQSDEWWSTNEGIGRGSSFNNIFFGVSIGMLGITGYETACNYIEEQGQAVFQKTLWNMWLLVSILNPGLAFVSLGVVPLSQFRDNSANLLSLVAEKSIGTTFRYLVAFDAVLALSGGALTAYVGVIGLITRMTQEGMLPSILLRKNRRTKSFQYIIASFFVLTSSLFILASGDITSLAGVYTISFLGVLLIAILGCVVIRIRSYGTHQSLLWVSWDVCMATVGIISGLIGQIIFSPFNFLFFTYYFVSSMILMVSDPVVFLSLMATSSSTKDQVKFWKDYIEYINNVQNGSSISKDDMVKDVLMKACETLGRCVYHEPRKLVIEALTRCYMIHKQEFIKQFTRLLDNIYARLHKGKEKIYTAAVSIRFQCFEWINAIIKHELNDKLVIIYTKFAEYIIQSGRKKFCKSVRRMVKSITKDEKKEEFIKLLGIEKNNSVEYACLLGILSPCSVTVSYLNDNLIQMNARQLNEYKNFQVDKVEFEEKLMNGWERLSLRSPETFIPNLAMLVRQLCRFDTVDLLQKLFDKVLLKQLQKSSSLKKDCEQLLKALVDKSSQQSMVLKEVSGKSCSVECKLSLIKCLKVPAKEVFAAIEVETNEQLLNAYCGLLLESSSRIEMPRDLVVKKLPAFIPLLPWITLDKTQDLEKYLNDTNIYEYLIIKSVQKASNVPLLTEKNLQKLLISNSSGSSDNYSPMVVINCLKQLVKVADLTVELSRVYPMFQHKLVPVIQMLPENHCKSFIKHLVKNTIINDETLNVKLIDKIVSDYCINEVVLINPNYNLSDHKIMRDLIREYLYNSNVLKIVEFEREFTLDLITQELNTLPCTSDEQVGIWKLEENELFKEIYSNETLEDWELELKKKSKEYQQLREKELQRQNVVRKEVENIRLKLLMLMEIFRKVSGGIDILFKKCMDFIRLLHAKGYGELVNSFQLTSEMFGGNYSHLITAIIFKQLNLKNYYSNYFDKYSTLELINRLVNEYNYKTNNVDLIELLIGNFYNQIENVDKILSQSSRLNVWLIKVLLLMLKEDLLLNLLQSTTTNEQVETIVQIGYSNKECRFLCLKALKEIQVCTEEQGRMVTMFIWTMQQHPDQVGAYATNLWKNLQMEIGSKFYLFLLPMLFQVEDDLELVRVISKSVAKALDIFPESFEPCVKWIFSRSNKEILEILLTELQEHFTKSTNRMVELINFCIDNEIHHLHIHQELPSELNAFVMEKLKIHGISDDLKEFLINILSNCSFQDNTKVVVDMLVQLLHTPSEQVQQACHNCLSKLNISEAENNEMKENLLEMALYSEKYSSRRGGAYGLVALRNVISGELVDRLTRDILQKSKNNAEIESCLMIFELLSKYQMKSFEPFVMQILPDILQTFGNSQQQVRQSARDCCRELLSHLSPNAVKLILPLVLRHLDFDAKWRSKVAAIEFLGSMVNLNSRELAHNLPLIIPKLTQALSDSHQQVRQTAELALEKFTMFVPGSVNKMVLLKALSDPQTFNQQALTELNMVSLELDSSSLALIIPILERGLSDRSTDLKKLSTNILINLKLVNYYDLLQYLPLIEPLLRELLVDSVPGCRELSARAYGTLFQRLGESAFPGLIKDLLQTLTNPQLYTSVDRQGSAQGLSHILSRDHLDKLLPDFLQLSKESPEPLVRESLMILYSHLLQQQKLSRDIPQIIPTVLRGLSDEFEFVRDASIKAGRVLIQLDNIHSLILPQLLQGMSSDDNYRLRSSSLLLVRDLLFKLAGISATNTVYVDVDDGTDEAEHSNNAYKKAIVDQLSQHSFNQVMARVFLCRCDIQLVVRQESLLLWKSLITNTPKMLKELLCDYLIDLILSGLSRSTTGDLFHASLTALNELSQKLGHSCISVFQSTIQKIITSTDSPFKLGASVALVELMKHYPDAFSQSHDLISVILIDNDPLIRSQAALAFSCLYESIGSRAIDNVLLPLLNNNQQNSLQGLKSVLSVRPQLFSVLLPPLLNPPFTQIKLQALTSLLEVATPQTVNKRFDQLVNLLLDQNDCQLMKAFVQHCIDEDLMHQLMINLHDKVKNKQSLSACCALLTQLSLHTTQQSLMNVYRADWIKLCLQWLQSDSDRLIESASECVDALLNSCRKEELDLYLLYFRKGVNTSTSDRIRGFNRLNGIKPFVPMVLQGLLNGTSSEVRELAAKSINDLIKYTDSEYLKPFIIQLTGPLIRVIGEKFNNDVKLAILECLRLLMTKCSPMIRPFLPQLQRTFVKSLGDPFLADISQGCIMELCKHVPNTANLIRELEKTPGEASSIIISKIQKK